MDDSVARDAKRLLLRYGAPISIVEKLPEDDQITYARSIIHTSLAERPAKVKALLSEGGWSQKR